MAPCIRRGWDGRTEPGTRPAPVVAVLVTVVLALVGTACGTGGGGDGESPIGDAGAVVDDSPAQPGGRIVYGVASETDGWNPSNSKWAPAGNLIARTFFDTLTAYDADLVARPNLAERLTPNEDHTQWTITLRPGVRLHNGRPVTAEVVKENFEFLKASVLTSSAFEPVESFATAGELDVVVTMKRPWVNYPYALATQIGVVADPDWLRSGSNTDPIGTGPFTFVEWVPDSKLVVRRNPDYWRTDPTGARLPYLDEIEFRPTPEAESRGAGLEAGNLDLIQTSSSGQIKQFTEAGRRGEYQVFTDAGAETTEVFIQLNTMVPPFDDPDARRALALATDTETYVQVLEQGLFEPARGPFAPGSRWYTETDYPSYDPSAAEELVEQVKARAGGEFRFEVFGPPDAHALQGLQLLQQQWKEVGIEMTIEPLETAQLITKVATGDYQATLWQQFASPHPLGDSIWWHPNTAKPIPEIALNFARNRNPRIGEALDRARETTDPDEETRLYQQVQRELATDIPYVWLYHTQISVVASTELVNVVNYTLPGGERGLPLQDGSHPLWQVWRRD